MRRAPRRAARLLCFGWCLLPGAALTGQGAPLTRGQEVRIFVTGVAGAFEGRLLGVNAQSVTVQVQNGTAFTLPTPQIQRAEVLGSRTNLRRGAIIGAGVGVGTGVAWAVVDRFEEWRLIVPALAGAAAGALVGNSIDSPQWLPGLLPNPADGDFAFGWRMATGPPLRRRHGDR